MDNFARLLWFAARAPIVFVIVAFNVNLWTLDPADLDPPTGALDELTAELHEGAGGDMQRLFPEGYVITHALVGFSWVDVALRAEPGSEQHSHALSQARAMERRIDTEKGREIFSDRLQPAHGAFYRGYLAWLRGGILHADPDAPPDEVEKFRRDCDEIAAALRAAQTPYLESYEHMAWPADSVFLVAALALHDKLFKPTYGADLQRWVRMVRERFDAELKMIPHAAEPGTGTVHTVPRGVSSVLMSRMLWEVDVELARDQYRKTRQHFVVSHLGLFPGIQEYADGHSGSGDVDTGPLILGISASASTVGVAAAKLHGDPQFADPTLIGLHAVGMPLGGRYGFGLLPVGEAFVAWTKTTTPWVGPEPTPGEWESIMLPGWRFVWHLLSALLLAVIFAGEILAALRARKLEDLLAEPQKSDIFANG